MLKARFTQGNISSDICAENCALLECFNMKFILYDLINGLASAVFGADVCPDYTPCKSRLNNFKNEFKSWLEQWFSTFFVLRPIFTFPKTWYRLTSKLCYFY
jgi:hypothetical protein